MPRFYFHLRNTLETDDEEGRELPDLEAARELALENAREIVCANIREGYLNLDHRIEVTDADGREVLVITFRDAFRIEED